MHQENGRLDVSRRALLTAVLAVGAMACAPWGALAQTDDYPARPIKVIVPYAAGGGDYQPREMAMYLSEILGQQVVIENRDGGGAVIGTTAAKNAAPDGYTLLWVGDSAMTVAPQMHKLSYSYEDFDFLGNTARTPLALVARQGRPYKTFEELIDFARKNPNTVLMGSAGTGTSTHMLGEAVQAATGVGFRHVPYKGLSGALAGLLSDNVDIIIGLPGPMIPHIQSNDLVVLATTGSERSKFLPEVPSFKEAGVNVVEETKYGWYVPKGVPEPIRKKLIDAIEKTAKTPAFVEAMEKAYTGVLYLDPETAKAQLKDEYAFWGNLLKEPQFQDLIDK